MFALEIRRSVLQSLLTGIRCSSSRAILPSRFKLSKTILGVKSNNTTKQRRKTDTNLKNNKTSIGSHGKLSTETKPGIFKYGEFGGLKKDLLGNQKDNTSKLIQKIHDFESLKLLPETRSILQRVILKESIALKNKLSGNEIVINPTPIQTLVIKQLSKKLMDPGLQVHAIAADTGSGKTMAYLFPLVDYLNRLDHEELTPKSGIQSVILVPTYELIQQVYNTLNLIQAGSKLHVTKWDNTTEYGNLLNDIKKRTDILVTTPNKLMSIFNIKMISRPDKILNNIKFTIIDEADTLMDPSWLDTTMKCIRQFKTMNHLLFCSATIPNEFNKTLLRIFPKTKVIMTPRLHKLSKKIEFKVIDSSLNPFKGSKMKALAQILYSIKKDSTEAGVEKRCIIFVNEKSEVKTVTERLRNEFKLECVGLSSEDTIEERLKQVTSFLQDPKSINVIINDKHIAKKDTNLDVEKPQKHIPGSNIILPPNRQHSISSRTKQETVLKILVCTDLLARGLNFQGVKNVILYDAPKTSIDLVHRVGRTGRMGQSGRVFMIIETKSRSWVKGIPKAIKNNVTLM